MVAPLIAALPSLIQAGGGIASNAALLSGLAGEGGEGSYEEAVAILQRVKEPDFDFSTLSPPQLQTFAEFFPEVYESTVPQEVKLIADSAQGRAGQVGALEQVQRTAQEGLPVSENIAAQEAQRAMANQAGREDSAIIADMANRGRLGGGTEVNARILQSQGRNDMARGMGADLATMREQNRYRAALDSADLSGQLRGMDVGVQEKNADMINRFNEYISAMMTQADRDAAATRNAGQLHRTEQAQRIGESNELARYGAAADNLNRGNQLEGALFDARLRKAGALSGTTQDLGRVQYADQAGREESIRGMFGAAGDAGSSVAKQFIARSGAPAAAAAPSPSVVKPGMVPPYASGVHTNVVDQMLKKDPGPWA